MAAGLTPRQQARMKRRLATAERGTTRAAFACGSGGPDRTRPACEGLTAGTAAVRRAGVPVIPLFQLLSPASIAFRDAPAALRIGSRDLHFLDL